MEFMAFQGFHVVSGSLKIGFGVFRGFLGSSEVSKAVQECSMGSQGISEVF